MYNKNALPALVLLVGALGGTATAAPITFEAKGYLTDAPTPPPGYLYLLRKCQKGVSGIPAFPAGTSVRIAYSFDSSAASSVPPPFGSYQSPSRVSLVLGSAPTVATSDPDAYLAVSDTTLGVEIFRHSSTLPDGTSRTYDAYYAEGGRLAGPEVIDPVSGLSLLPEEFHLTNFGTLYTTDGPIPENPPALAQNQLNEIVFSTEDLGTCQTSFFHLTSLEKVAPDVVPPTLSFVTPTSGQEIALGSAQSFSYSCSDPAGITTCLGTSPPGSAIDTSSLGAQALTVLAEDANGNRTTQTITFSVVRVPGPPADPGPPTDPGQPGNPGRPTNPGPPPGRGP